MDKGTYKEATKYHESFPKATKVSKVLKQVIGLPVGDLLVIAEHELKARVLVIFGEVKPSAWITVKLWNELEIVILGRPIPDFQEGRFILNLVSSEISLVPVWY